MNITQAAKDAWEVWNFLKMVVKYRGRNWVSPKESKPDDPCAVMEIHFDVQPGTVSALCAFLAAKRIFDHRVNASHPVFRWMGDNAKEGKPAEMTAVISLRPRIEAKTD